MQKSIRVASILLLLLSSTTASMAQRYGGGRYRWEYLGQAHVDGKNDHDIIQVNQDGFRAIQIGVKGGAIEFQRVIVHFENGQDFPADIRYRINSGGRTRAIDLPGERRRIKSVEFFYSKANWRTRPSVNLWGAR